MARLYCWAPVGQRCRDSAPFGHWKTLAFIAGLRLSGLTAPWVLDGLMDGAVFRVYVRDVLAPSLRPGDAVVLDNFPSRKVAGVREPIDARQAQAFYLPPYGPDINPIEMAFAKPKALLRQGQPELSMLLLSASEACSSASSQTNAPTSSTPLDINAQSESALARPSSSSRETRCKNIGKL